MERSRLRAKQRWNEEGRESRREKRERGGGGVKVEGLSGRKRIEPYPGAWDDARSLFRGQGAC